MARPTRDQILLRNAKDWAERSTCLRKRVGAVIAYEGRPLSIGYNGAPPNLPHCTPETCTPDHPCFRAIHAEANAIAWAARKGVSTEGANLYVTVSPCNECAKLIIAAGIVEVHFIEKYRDGTPILLLQRAGITCLWHHEEL